MKIYGKNCVYEAIRAKRTINEIHILKDSRDKNFIDMCRDKKIKVFFDEKKDMDKKFGPQHQGYGALVKDYTYSELDFALKKKYGRRIFLALDGLEDPHNLGAIIRSCDAFSVDGIILPKNHSVGITEVVAHVSTGAIEYVPIIMVNNLNNALLKLKDNGYWIVGTDAAAEQEPKDIDKSLDIVVIIGSEGFGISRLTAKNCDYMIKIPMTGHVNSLNASVSAGIIIAELV